MNQTKLRTTVSYQLNTYKMTILWMYLALFTISLLLFALQAKKPYNTNNGLEFTSLITIFIIGLNSFKEDFKFFSANGISRKTLFCSTVFSLSVLSFVFALINTISTIPFTRIGVLSPMVLLMYHQRYGYASFADIRQAGCRLTPQFLLDNLLWIFFAGLFLAALGLVITTLYYRLSKPFKIAFSIGVPFLLFFGTPLLDELFFQGILIKSIFHSIVMVLGLSGECNPYTAMLTFFLLSCAAFALSFLITRKVPIKK